jgi:hypothetical protein
MIRLQARPLLPPSNQQIVCVSPVHFWRVGGAWAGGGGAESYDRKKAWASINSSILFGLEFPKKNRMKDSAALWGIFQLINLC